MKHRHVKIGKGARSINTRILPHGLVLLILACVTHGWAQTALPALGARGVALGGAMTAVEKDEDALMGNPACLGRDHARILVSWRPGLFGLGTLARGSMSWTQPIGAIGGGMALATDGGGEYRRIVGALGASIEGPLGIVVGLAGRVEHLGLGRYGDALRPQIDLGALARIGDRVTVGAVWHADPGLGSKQADGDRASLGVAYRDASLLVTMDLEQELRFRPAFRLGTEWAVWRNIHLRVGNRTEPAALSMGLGFSTDWCRLDYTCVTHPELPWSHALSLLLLP